MRKYLIKQVLGGKMKYMKLVISALFLIGLNAQQSGAFSNVELNYNNFGVKTINGDAADVDHDGDLDFLTSQSYFSHLHFTRNDGNGLVNYYLTNYANDGKFIDFDGDGFVDIANVYNYGTGGLQLRQNNQAGGFNLISTTSTTDQGTSLMNINTIAAGDYDADGDEDIILAGSRWNQNVIVLQNDGTGNFTEAYKFTWGNGQTNDAVEVQFADFDGDGDLDFMLLIQSWIVNSPLPMVWENTGTSFQPAFTESAPGIFLWNRDASVADLDNDGDLDIVAQGTHGSGFTGVMIYENTGAFNFTIHNLYDQSTQSMGGVRAADFDYDGDMDLVTTTGTQWDAVNGQRLMLMENVGGLTFVPSWEGSKLTGTLATIVNSIPWVGDAEGDGDLEVLTGEYYSGYLWGFNSPPPVVAPPNTAPVANAGVDQSVVPAAGTASVTLDGTGSYDADGDILTYTWRKNATILATGATATVSLMVGVHTIELTVDDGLATSVDTVVITVAYPISEFFTDQLTGPDSPQLPVINAGYTYTTSGLYRAQSTMGWDGWATGNEDRPMIKTAYSSYLSSDFRAEVTIARTNANQIKDLIYFGFGTGEPNPSYFEEPTNSFYFRIHYSSGYKGIQGVYYEGNTSPGFNSTNLANLGNYNPAGTTLRIEKVGTSITLSIVGGGSVTYQTTSVGSINANNGYVFFGNGAQGTTFSSLSVAPALTNQAPVASAGVDQSFDCVVGTVSATLDGSGSSDPDGDPLTYSWSDGTSVVSTAASFTATLGAGTHTYTLTVDDGNGGTASDQVIVTVIADTEPPVLTLTGNNPIQTICHYGYTDPGVTVTDACDSNPTVTMTSTVDTLTLGSYGVTYTATDAAGNSASVTRVVEVINHDPVVANAPADVVLSFGDSDISSALDLSNVFTDPDGHPLTFSASIQTNDAVAMSFTDPTATVSALDLGTTTVTVTATDVCGGSISAEYAVTVNVTADLADAVVFALEKAELKKETTVTSGNLIVNTVHQEDVEEHSDDDEDHEKEDEDHYELKLDGKVTTAAGFFLKANGVQIKKGAEVGGDVFANVLDNKGDVFGNQYSPVTVPVFSNLPPFKSNTGGTAKVKVGKNQTQTLTPGDYGKVEVGENGTLNLTGGEYHFKSIKLKKKARLRFDAAAQVTVVEEFKAEKQTYVGPANGALIDASGIIFYVAGEDEDKVEFGERSQVFATVYAPTSKIKLKKDVEFTGALYGNKVHIDKEATLTLDSYFGDGTQVFLARQATWKEPVNVEDVSLPSTFTLHQNYPNPFNPTTTLSYELDNNGPVQLVIYDLTGREVATLVNHYQPAGRYSLQFDASELSTGTYLVVLTSNGRHDVQKMTLLK